MISPVKKQTVTMTHGCILQLMKATSGSCRTSKSVLLRKTNRQQNMLLRRSTGVVVPLSKLLSLSTNPSPRCQQGRHSGRRFLLLLVFSSFGLSGRHAKLQLFSSLSRLYFFTTLLFRLPAPIFYFRHIIAIFLNISFVVYQFVSYKLFDPSRYIF